MNFRFSESLPQNKVKSDKHIYYWTLTSTYTLKHVLCIHKHSILHAYSKTKRIQLLKGMETFISAAYLQRLQVSQKNIWCIISRHQFLTPSLASSPALTEAVTLGVPLHIVFVMCSWCLLLRGKQQCVPSSHTIGYPVDVEWWVHFDAYLIQTACFSNSTLMLQEGISLLDHHFSTTWHQVDTQQKVLVWGALLSYWTLTSRI